MTTRSTDRDRASRIFLLVSIALTVGLYAIPYGRVVAYPFVLVSTVAHELGHGITAMLLGGDFESLLIWPDGSGAALWRASVGRVGRAAIAAGGLLGPAMAAAILFLAGRTAKGTRIGLVALAVILTIAELFVVRTFFGVVFVAGLIVLAVALVRSGREWLYRTALVFLGVQLALSVFSRGDYLFTDIAQTAEGPRPSDVAQMADALLLPYWFWGAVCGLVSVAVLVGGVWVFVRPVGRRPSARSRKTASR